MNNGLANWCDFCQCSHSSSSCFHPGRKMLYALEAERDELQRKLNECEKSLKDIRVDVNSGKSAFLHGGTKHDIMFYTDRSLDKIDKALKKLVDNPPQDGGK